MAALWDIKGKMAGMPVHDLLGGKTRKACPVYVHADGNLPTDEGEHFAEAKEMMAMGFRHIRLQYNGYGANVPTDSKVERPPGASDGPRSLSFQFLTNFKWKKAQRETSTVCPDTAPDGRFSTEANCVCVPIVQRPGFYV
jgi:hypothetical protein